MIGGSKLAPCNTHKPRLFVIGERAATPRFARHGDSAGPVADGIERDGEFGAPRIGQRCETIEIGNDLTGGSGAEWIFVRLAQHLPALQCSGDIALARVIGWRSDARRWRRALSQKRGAAGAGGEDYRRLLGCGTSGDSQT
jgi:hypothetical protein